MALLPFGAGQFQNREPVLGWMFLVTESALVVGTMITVPLYIYAHGRANGQGSDFEGKAEIYRQREETIQTVNLSLVGAFVAVAIAGIVQANLAYVPEVSETRKRDLPPQARLVPTVTPIARGEGGTTPRRRRIRDPRHAVLELSAKFEGAPKLGESSLSNSVRLAALIERFAHEDVLERLALRRRRLDANARASARSSDLAARCRRPDLEDERLAEPLGAFARARRARLRARPARR